METLIGSGVTGAVVALAIILSRTLEKAIDKKNGGPNGLFRVDDRDALQRVDREVKSICMLMDDVKDETKLQTNVLREVRDEIRRNHNG